MSLFAIGLGMVIAGVAFFAGGICGWRSGWDVGRKELIRFQRQHERARERAEQLLRPRGPQP
jgi:hypothetical protein